MTKEFDASKSLATPVGPITLKSMNEKLVSVELGKKAKDQGQSITLELAAQQLEEYFSGKRKAFRLPTKVSGTEFQLAVWKEISKLKSGQFTSYGEIAKAIGKPAASRAVGAAVGANPIPLVVGCHRVLGSSGKITGFTGGKGIKTKAWLLEHERISFRP